MLKLENVSYSYTAERQILENIDFAFESGKIYAIMGKSGSGKSTLLSLLGGAMKPQTGCIYYDGKDIGGLKQTEYLRNCCTTIYQNFQLFPLLTVEENIMYPMELQGVKRKDCLAKVDSLMETVALAPELKKHLPGTISGGEQQRVAIARALATGARVILADEPTGNLDKDRSDIIIDLLVKLAHEEKYCIIVATHDIEVSHKMDVVLRVERGQLYVDDHTK